MPEYHAQVNYATPAGRIGFWSGMIAAPHIPAAHAKANKVLRQKRRVGKIWSIHIYPPKESQS